MVLTIYRSLKNDTNPKSNSKSKEKEEEGILRLLEPQMLHILVSMPY